MKQTDKKGLKNRVGAQGEQIASQYLRQKEYKILDLNYLKKWGEIDIVARETTINGPMVHFVEVKTVSYETKLDLETAVSRRTWRPEENVHKTKLQRLSRTIDSWLSERKYDGEWQIDIVAVRIVPREKYATVKIIPNVIM